MSVYRSMADAMSPKLQRPPCTAVREGSLLADRCMHAGPPGLRVSAARWERCGIGERCGVTTHDSFDRRSSSDTD